MSGNRKPLKIGVRLDPPAIVCIYKQSNKLRMRVMPLRNVWAKTDTNFLFDDLRNRHGKYLESIPKEMIIKMINIIKEHLQGMKLQDILKKYDSKISETKMKDFNDSSQTSSKFAALKKNELMEELKQKGNSDDEDSIEYQSDRNIENKNRIVRSKFTMNKKSNVTFGKKDSNSDSDEFDSGNNRVEINFDSDEDFEINKVMKDKEENKIEPFKSSLRKNELTDVKNFPKLGIRDSSKNFTKEIITNNVLKPDIKVKNQLKELLDLHDKIESPSNSKKSKSEDDTDVEFDDSDIPLEEDFY